MSELEFPEIADEIADEVVERVTVAPPTPAAPVAAVFSIDTVRATALAELSAVDRGIAELKAKHGATDYDITTPAGYKLAVARRYAIRQVRYRVPHVVKERKADLKNVVDALTSEGDRIAAALQAIEDAHDTRIEAEDERRATIKAEEERKAAEAAAETARIETERRAAHEAFIATIRAYLGHCQKPGMTAERIGNGIAALEAVGIGTEREEFEAPAMEAKAQTLAAMRDLHASVVVFEAEAVRLEAQRIANEKLAAELAEQSRRINEQAAALKRAQDAAQAIIDDAAAKQLLADASALLERQRAEQAAAPVAPPAPEPAPEPIAAAAPCTVPASQPEFEAAFAAANAEPEAPTEPMTKLGDIKARLGFALPEDFITTTMQVPPSKVERGACFYTATQVAAIKRALLAHIERTL